MVSAGRALRSPSAPVSQGQVVDFLLHQLVKLALYLPFLRFQVLLLVPRHLAVKDLREDVYLLVQHLQFVVEVRLVLLLLRAVYRFSHVLGQGPVLLRSPLQPLFRRQ